jgi:hypothetical protein
MDQVHGMTPFYGKFGFGWTSAKVHLSKITFSQLLDPGGVAFIPKGMIFFRDRLGIKKDPKTAKSPHDLWEPQLAKKQNL